MQTTSNLSFYPYNYGYKEAMRLIAHNGDISFYEDTGTTAKFFWDSSAESLGIGTSSPAGLLHLSETGDGTKLRITRGGLCEWDFSIGNTSTLTGVGAGALELLPLNAGTTNEFAIGTAGTTAPLFHLKNDQNYFAKKVGIGTTSPSSILHIEGNTNTYTTAPILYFGSTSAANPAVRDWAIGPADSAYGDFHIYQGASTGASPLATSNAKLTINVSGNVGIGTTVPSSKLTVNGSLSKSSGSFRIDHPLEAKSTTHDLVHSFVEAPQADNIYRGKVDLVSGSATVNIDTVAGMTEGTFVALNREVQCFTTNESDAVNTGERIDGSIQQYQVS
jgi:hypothetical protein